LLTLLQKQHQIAFKTWQKSWRRSTNGFRNKNRALIRRGLDALPKLVPFIENETRYMFHSNLLSNLLTFSSLVYDIIPPHKFFSNSERAVYRNACTWMVKDDGWYDLPGPAEWYPEDYNFKKHGFDVLAKDDGHEEAFTMVWAESEPERFNMILPSMDELQVMPDGLQTQLIQQIYLS
jgi:hypothetical protein